MSCPTLSSSQFVDVMIQRKYEVIHPTQVSDFQFKEFYQLFVDVLSGLSQMNLNPEHYAMFLAGLDDRQWKNLYRHIIIKWVQFLQSTSSDNNNYKWTLDWSTLSKLEGYSVIVSAIIDSWRSFLTNDNPDTINFRLLFLVNSVQNYFIPV